ncbi:MAG TPA: ATP-binding protein [Acidimicrobiales bacterium]
MGRVILMCGLPASGKTTRARELAVERHALRLSPDEWLNALGYAAEDPARLRVEALQWNMAIELALAGDTVILENGFWPRSERDERRSAARAAGVEIELVCLDVSVDELRDRLRARNESPTEGSFRIDLSDFESWIAYFDRPSEEEFALFDPGP